jgi:hypothetical protein
MIAERLRPSSIGVGQAKVSFWLRVVLRKMFGPDGVCLAEPTIPRALVVTSVISLGRLSLIQEWSGKRPMLPGPAFLMVTSLQATMFVGCPTCQRSI